MSKLESIRAIMDANSARHFAEVIDLREKFSSKPGAHVELLAYEERNNERDYVILKGLIPPKLIGKVTTGLGLPWAKSDTFFTDYASHYPAERILSAREKSLIICNSAAHDVRLYSSDVDPTNTDKSSSAGMSYMHLLVIPTAKVYNVVSLSSYDIVDEMQTHFDEFWGTPQSVEIAIKAINDAMSRRYAELVRCYEESDPSTSSKRISDLNSVMHACRASAQNFASRLRSKRCNVVYGFHVHPHASVGHLHMHVLLEDESYREHSTFAHDWKTISASVVKRVLEHESGRVTQLGQ